MTDILETTLTSESEATSETFTLEQVTAMIESKLAAERQSFDRQIQAVRAEAIRQVKLSKGTADATDVVTEFTQQHQAKAAKDRADYESLGILFGPKSNAAAAAELYKKDVALYRRLKTRAEEVGLVDKPNRAVERRLFHPANRG